MGLNLGLMLWVAAAGLLGFGVSALFAGVLKLSRRLFLAPYVLLSGAFLAAFTVFNRVDVAEVLRHNWVWGAAAGVLLSVYLITTVRRQPVSQQLHGAQLAGDIAWAGLVYGVLDALFLNVMPVVAVSIGFSQLGWAGSLWGKLLVGFIGLLSSLLVTLTYHLGYPEFRSRRVLLVLAGNSLITLAFLLSGNPFGSIISHTAMHVAAVIQGPETTIQLPPHYQPVQL